RARNLQVASAARARTHPQLRPSRQGSRSHLGHGGGGQGISEDHGQHEALLGCGGHHHTVAGGIGVMNVMLVAVRERTREIGVRKAVGASAKAILTQFFIEALIVVFLSGGLGMGIAYGLCALVDLLPMPAFFAGLLPTWQSAVISFAILGTIAVCSALYPARRDALVDPIEALRYEPGG